MEEFGDLENVLTQLLERNIIVGPAFSSISAGGLDSEVYAIIQGEAKGLSLRYWRNPHPILRNESHETTSHLIEQALCEVISSTAAYLSHLRLGHLHVDETMVRVSSRLIEDFLNQHHTGRVIAVALMVHTFDDYLALHFYGEIKEIDFITGVCHRPWIHYSLESELEFLRGRGSIIQYTRGKTSYVALTEFGKERYEKVQMFLERTGFLQRRHTIARWSQFSQMEDYDDILNQISKVDVLRQQTIEESGIVPGMTVLEAGCGTGGLTIDAGLSQLVGPTGSVIATDPSVGMLARAKTKATKMNIRNTSFRQAPAEELPFEDNTFDAVIGFGFLHFTRMSDALKEIHRVAKPNAWFATAYPLHVPDSNPYFGEWFAPLLTNNHTTNTSRDMLPGEDTVRGAIPDDLYTHIDIRPMSLENNYGNPEAVVKFYVQVINAFEPVMNTLPWKAQQEMIESLIDRGRDIVATYGEDRLRIRRPCQMLKARVRK